ncbi:small nuclear ribonucleoprotein E [Cocos nucifera]|uniref:Small nuclear ribonucleoprotein E n=1 Tax=Cocos nucifera TaxID=13894 RepID=A0A8K0IQ80_COCNU|nr:small nuclear ribonucleoprotein E [Cocos nucifera]
MYVCRHKQLLYLKLESPPLIGPSSHLPQYLGFYQRAYRSPARAKREGEELAEAEGEVAMASTKVQRIMTQPINLIFRFLQSKARIQIWLFEQRDLRIEGRIIGFDEYMNLVLDDADELNIKKNTRKPLGRILLKGDNITLMMSTGK